MSEDVGQVDASVWPMPKFHFRMAWDGGEIAFQEVDGLDTESQVIEYRAGNSKVFSNVKMPGVAKSGNVTLKKGFSADGNALWDWVNEIRMNTITRMSVTISLMDEGNEPTMVWKLKNAFPIKISGTDLKAGGNEVAIESIELAHEGLTTENG